MWGIVSISRSYLATAVSSALQHRSWYFYQKQLAKMSENVHVKVYKKQTKKGLKKLLVAIWHCRSKSKGPESKKAKNKQASS